MAAPGDHPLQHLGEAESIVLAKHLGGRTFLTQDGDAAARARFDRVPVMWVTEVLAELVLFGDATESEAWRIAERLMDMGRLPGGLARRGLFG
ncbi:MAG: hypothetical protein U0Q22_06465 [Acidimicrobiales bacterium]